MDASIVSQVLFDISLIGLYCNADSPKQRVGYTCDVKAIVRC
jgi:hypothetical protein